MTFKEIREKAMDLLEIASKGFYHEEWYAEVKREFPNVKLSLIKNEVGKLIKSDWRVQYINEDKGKLYVHINNLL